MLFRLEDGRRDVTVDRLGELSGESLLGRRSHQIDLDDKDALADQVAERGTDK